MFSFTLTEATSRQPWIGLTLQPEASFEKVVRACPAKSCFLILDRGDPCFSFVDGLRGVVECQEPLFPSCCLVHSTVHLVGPIEIVGAFQV